MANIEDLIYSSFPIDKLAALHHLDISAKYAVIMLKDPNVFIRAKTACFCMNSHFLSIELVEIILQDPDESVRSVPFEYYEDCPNVKRLLNSDHIMNGIQDHHEEVVKVALNCFELIEDRHLMYIMQNRELTYPTTLWGKFYEAFMKSPIRSPWTIYTALHHKDPTISEMASIYINKNLVNLI